MIAAGVAAYRRPARISSRRTTDAPTPRWIVMLLRIGLLSMGVIFGMTTWVASSASIEMVMLFTVFPRPQCHRGHADRRPAGHVCLRAAAHGRVVRIHAGNNIGSTPAGLAVRWLFYVAALGAIHSILSEDGANRDRTAEDK